jgi:large subunit ribosomal protein L23
MLLKPLITEVSLKRAADRNYTFVVSTQDTKTDIKRLVEKTFGVKVLTVNTMNMPGKEYRTGRRGAKALSSEWKKAIVQISKDQKIDLFDTPESK